MINYQLIICPGIHSKELTQDFTRNLNLNNINIFPAHKYPAYSSYHLWRYIQEIQSNPKKSLPLTLIAFSAGVVAAIGAAYKWQINGGKIDKLIAIDGWGVPLIGNFPIYRLSHDYYTHWTSAMLGSGINSFYAHPPVKHLDIWRTPQTTTGWWVKSLGCKTKTNASEFIIHLLGLKDPKF